MPAETAVQRPPLAVSDALSKFSTEITGAFPQALLVDRNWRCSKQEF
jgi:hypothetical protein